MREVKPLIVFKVPAGHSVSASDSVEYPLQHLQLGQITVLREIINMVNKFCYDLLDLIHKCCPYFINWLFYQFCVIFFHLFLSVKCYFLLVCCSTIYVKYSKYFIISSVQENLFLLTIGFSFNISITGGVFLNSASLSMK